MHRLLLTALALAGTMPGAFAQEAPQLRGRLSASVSDAHRGTEAVVSRAASPPERSLRQRTIRIISIERPVTDGGLAERRMAEVRSGR